MIRGERANRYYAREVARRLRHYAATRVRGYRNRGSLSEAARSILAERAAGGLVSGAHFRGVWPRDCGFAAAGLCAAGHAETLCETGSRLVRRLRQDDVFYTDVHEEYAAATPAEGVDSVPMLVIALAECDGLAANVDDITRLVTRHRNRYFDDERSIVSGAGSSWWDSAATPRETYNTAVLLAAIERLEAANIETAYAGLVDDVRAGLLDQLWVDGHFAEHRGSTTLACDANVVPLYFGLVDDARATAIVGALDRLRTPHGRRLRAKPFTRSEVRPHFWLHPDYHYHVWPWNSYMYAIGAHRYGFYDRARRECERVDAVQRQYGTFLEVIGLDGTPYAKRGYASASDFTVAAALWTQERDQRAAADPS